MMCYQHAGVHKKVRLAYKYIKSLEEWMLKKARDSCSNIVSLLLQRAHQQKYLRERPLYTADNQMLHTYVGQRMQNLHSMTILR